MGVIISRFRSKETTVDKLDRLENEIQRLEQDNQCTELRRNRVIGSVMVYSVGIYVLFAILYYFMYVGRTQHWLQSVLYASPLLVLPIIVILLRSTIQWYYMWSINKKRVVLKKCKADKKKILEDVMNRETYKVAKEILDKYGSPDEQTKSLKPFVPTTNVPGKPITPTPATPGQLKQRQLAIQNSSPLKNNVNIMVPLTSTPTPMYKGPRLRSDQLPRPLLDKNRSALDKVVDYLLKDGPNHRMALICANCFSHNGMAMVEEFDYVSYVCAYCGKLNPARKQRPAAPLLSPLRALPPPPLRRSQHGSGDDSSIASSASESDDDKNSPKSAREIGTGSEGETDRPPSPMLEESPKSSQEKKED